jgi:uncharacterized protein YuzE
MNLSKVKYDEISDTLTIGFTTATKATGIELNESILLRINLDERKAVSLNLLNYSVIAQSTEIGIRSFPLTGLSQLSEDLKNLVINILLTQPVNEFLVLSAYSPSLNETIPIVSFKQIYVAMNAA